MGQDDQPKHRQQARKLQRRRATRQPYERILIVCEGAKTEPAYLDAIRASCRLSTANVQVVASKGGTEPLQIVNFAESLFRRGNAERNVIARAFDRVVVVFDRDAHHSYQAALAKATALSGKLRNEEGGPVPFDAVASVPCFELWLLLHFEDVRTPLTANEALSRLTAYLPGYSKASGDHWAETRDRLPDAERRAELLARTAEEGNQGPYTGVHRLVRRLLDMARRRP